MRLKNYESKAEAIRMCEEITSLENGDDDE